VPRDGVEVTVRGLREARRAADNLPADARRIARAGAVDLSRELANVVRAAGRSDTRQSARASRTVRTQTAGLSPKIVAGPHPLLFGSEFGIKRRTGWYGAKRYSDSPARQFRAHRGSSSYWFFKTIDENRARIQRAHADMMSSVVRSWSA
jgi:hypothetical protein